MRSRTLWVLAPGLIILVALALSSCGSSSPTSSGSVSAAQSKFAPPTAPPSNARKGGTLNVLAAGDVDFLDPGAAYYTFTYMVTDATQRALVSWQPDDVLNPTPDLADGPLQVSSDYKTVTAHIKKGIHYSPPVNREVTSADVKYALERTLLPGVPNGYFPVYFAAIDGLAEAQAAVKKDPTTVPDIKGITTPDKYTVVLKFTQPSGTVVAQALSLPASAPVPEEYAKQYDSQSPSTYGENQVATGPYMVTNYQPGKDITLERNPNWDASTDWRPAYLDKIDIQEGFSDTVSATRKILTGTSEVNGDFGLPATGVKLAATQYPDQLTLTPNGAFRYVAMDTTKPPFDDINVRKAVIANSDRNALQGTRGGPLIGDVATHFIPPGIPGFDEAGGVAGPQGSEFDFVQTPGGDPALAASYMKKAGYSSGKCTGSCDITMVGDNAAPGSDTAQLVKGQLEDLGFKVSFQAVSHDLMYTKFCQIPKNEPNVCPNVAWGKDFNDPQSILDPTFAGHSITPSANYNYPLLDDPAINKQIDKATLIQDPTQRAQAWGAIDDAITAQAVGIPWLWDNFSSAASSNVLGVITLATSNWDLSFTSLGK